MPRSIDRVISAAAYTVLVLATAAFSFAVVFFLRLPEPNVPAALSALAPWLVLAAPCIFILFRARRAA